MNAALGVLMKLKATKKSFFVDFTIFSNSSILESFSDLFIRVILKNLDISDVAGMAVLKEVDRSLNAVEKVNSVYKAKENFV